MEELRGYFNVPTHDNSDVFTKVTRIKISVLYNDFITKRKHINKNRGRNVATKE